MKEQIKELEKRHRRDNLQVMSIKRKVGTKSKTWGESEAKVKVFLQEKLGLENEKITIQRAHEIRMKGEGRKRTITAKFLNCKRCEKVPIKYRKLILSEDRICISKDFSGYTVERNLLI